MNADVKMLERMIQALVDLHSGETVADWNSTEYLRGQIELIVDTVGFEVFGSQAEGDPEAVRDAVWEMTRNRLYPVPDWACATVKHGEDHWVLVDRPSTLRPWRLVNFEREPNTTQDYWASNENIAGLLANGAEVVR